MAEYCEYMWDPTRGHGNLALARSIYQDEARFNIRDRKLAIKTVRAILRDMPGVGELYWLYVIFCERFFFLSLFLLSRDERTITYSERMRRCCWKTYMPYCPIVWFRLQIEMFMNLLKCMDCVVFVWIFEVHICEVIAVDETNARFKLEMNICVISFKVFGDVRKMCLC